MENLQKQEARKRDIELALSQINQYAWDHSLSGQKLRDIFSAGIVSSVRDGSLKVPAYGDGELPGTPVEETLFGKGA